MKYPIFLIPFLIPGPGCFAAAAPEAPGPPASAVPEAVEPRSTQRVAAGADTPDTPYLAFPAVLDQGNEVLVSFKRGRSHAADGGAVLDVARLDKATGRVLSRGLLAAREGEILQMGEWVRFANGDIASYIDAQDGRQAPLRTGLAVVRSTDGGRTFGPAERLGPVDGVEYGYAFDSITREGRTWMLVMTFANLPGGTLVHQTRSQPGSVDVIRSDDQGRSWSFVRSLTDELGGAPINESAFVPVGEGFLITARGYDGRHWLARTDAGFAITARTDLNAAEASITSHLGRPRLVTRDGAIYLLARNWIEPGIMQLAWFRIDPATLGVTRHLVLDNAERRRVADGYYAQPCWWRGEGGEELHVFTYRRDGGAGCDLLRLVFDWEDLR